VGKPGRDEIWAHGLRNPRGISFDRITRTIAIGDVGNERYEEIDYLPISKARGANFGWPAYEAFAPFRGGVPRHDTVLPAIAYRHGPGCAVAGGFVVRDPHLARIRGREIFGDYVFGDYCTGRLYGFRPRVGRRAGKQRSFNFGTRYLTSIGEDNERHIYVITERGPAHKGKATLGSVYRLVPHRKELPN
jgi:Glucose / Sorbosone dehydrogenase